MSPVAPSLDPDDRAGLLRQLRERPAYPLTEAARYLRVAPATLRAWVCGRRYATQGGDRRSAPLIVPAESGPPPLLSFNNLIEAYVLRALRTVHDTPLPAIRAALAYAERELRIERLLLSRALATRAREVCLEHYGELRSLWKSGQLAVRAVVEAYLSRIDWDEAGRLPLRLYPLVATERVDAPRHIAIDPAIGFGRPVVRSRGISTRVIAERIDAGETVAELADDYGLAPAEIEEAVVYERAA